MQTITEELAQKVLDLVGHGLVRGKGVQEPGMMCVEAAVCSAMGLPHSDEPPCVHAAVRSFKITLNDITWSSDMARAKGMRRVAIAQLGSTQIDGRAFADHVMLGIVRGVLPIGLRAAGLDDEACQCEGVQDLDEWRALAEYVHAAHDSYAYAIYYADASASTAVAYAGDYVAYAYAAAAADADADARDEVLSLAAEIAVEALIECGAEGCAFLGLTE